MSPLRPEQDQARAYLRDKGTRLPVVALRDRVGAGFGAIEALVRGVTPEQARARSVPGEWTVHEVVDHLVQTHEASLGELRDLLAGRCPAGPPVPPGLQSPDPHARTWPDLVAALVRVQAEVLEVLGAAPEAPTAARAPVVMVVNAREPDGRSTLLEWIEELDWKAYAAVFRLHVLDHAAQIREVLRAAAGPAPP